MKLNAKIWIEDDSGKPLIGDGRLKLLLAIKEHGSLKAATESLGMSYRHAWGQLRKIEDRTGMKLMERTTGGAGGGGSTLTVEALNLIEEFERLEAEVRDFLKKRSETLGR